MFGKRRKRKKALQRLKKMSLAAEKAKDPISHAYKQQRLLRETADVVEKLLEGEIKI